jgi:hypothetical protein
MNKDEFWRNFSLNRELHVSGAFIYDGIHELKTLTTFAYADEVFQVVYPLAVGFERLLKIAIVLLEFKPGIDQAEFEKSLITHNHLELLKRLRLATKVNLMPEHNELLQILGKFYKSYRYDRFTINSVFSDSPETEDLLRYLSKHVAALEPSEPVFGGRPACPQDVKIFLARVCRKIATDVYQIIERAAKDVPLYTYELRSDSKASKVFLFEELHFLNEELLWKELLVFLMKTTSEPTELKLLRQVEPLDFDPGMIPDYLACFSSDKNKIGYIEELKELYRNIPNPSERLELMTVIGSGVCFIEDDDSEDPEGT